MHSAVRHGRFEQRQRSTNARNDRQCCAKPERKNSKPSTYMVWIRTSEDSRPAFGQHVDGVEHLKRTDAGDADEHRGRPSIPAMSPAGTRQPPCAPDFGGVVEELPGIETRPARNSTMLKPSACRCRSRRAHRARFDGPAASFNLEPRPCSSPFPGRTADAANSDDRHRVSVAMTGRKDGAVTRDEVPLITARRRARVPPPRAPRSPRRSGCFGARSRTPGRPASPDSSPGRSTRMWGFQAGSR